MDALQQHAQTYYQGRNLRLILLLDEMDVISNYDHLIQQQLRRIFMRDFSATLGAVVAGIQISKEWDRVESPWFNLFNEIALQPFHANRRSSCSLRPSATSIAMSRPRSNISLNRAMAAHFASSSMRWNQ